MRNEECGMRNEECGMWNEECGMRNEGKRAKPPFGKGRWVGACSDSEGLYESPIIMATELNSVSRCARSFMQSLSHHAVTAPEELSKSSIWYTTPMQQRSKSRFICDWLRATAATYHTPTQNKRFLLTIAASLL